MTEDRDRDEMQRLLAYANFSKVAEAVGVKRAAVANWAAGRHVTPARLEQVRALYGLPVASQGTTKEAPRPEWAEGLENRIALEVASVLASPDRVQAALIGVERLAELERLRGEQHGAENGLQDQAGSKP